MEHVTHGFPPLYDQNSRVLILGSMPSPRSREQGFYYGHPQNRFWRLMAAVLGEEIPRSIEEKKALMLSHGIALWDALEECDIDGASDSSIKNPVAADIPALLRNSRVFRIFTTGAAAYRYYMKYNYPLTGIKAVRLPSTSPANCAASFEELYEAYKAVDLALRPEYSSPLGRIYLSADELGLTGLWLRRPEDLPSCYPGPAAARFGDMAKLWLDEYFEGHVPDWYPPLNLKGTDFQKEVWAELLTIPYGGTVTYGELAARLAERRGIKRMSAQAVGGAVGRNPVSIIVPCHRVMGAGGDLTGYGGGIENKAALLRLEGAFTEDMHIPKGKKNDRK